MFSLEVLGADMAFNVGAAPGTAAKTRRSERVRTAGKKRKLTSTTNQHQADFNVPADSFPSSHSFWDTQIHCDY